MNTLVIVDVQFMKRQEVHPPWLSFVDAIANSDNADLKGYLDPHETLDRRTLHVHVAQAE